MSRLRRPIAFFAALAVVWTALWPLVSAARTAATGEPIMLCHQAGMQVALDELPNQPGAPSGEPKFHCPLCVMAFLGGFNPPLQAPPFLFSTCTVTPDAHCAAVPSGTEVQLPQSRAPPRTPSI